MQVSHHTCVPGLLLVVGSLDVKDFAIETCWKAMNYLLCKVVKNCKLKPLSWYDPSEKNVINISLLVLFTSEKASPQNDARTGNSVLNPEMKYEMERKMTILHTLDVTEKHQA